MIKIEESEGGVFTEVTTMLSLLVTAQVVRFSGSRLVHKPLNPPEADKP